jgi:hypothetical protein
MVDTPGFEHGANVSGRRVDPGPFLYSAQDVARALVGLARKPRDEVAVGWPARAAQLSYALARGPTERASAAGIRRLLSRATQAPITEGALLDVVSEGAGASGGWLARKRLPPAGAVTSVLVLAGVAAASIGAAAVLLRAASKRPRIDH